MTPYLCVGMGGTRPLPQQPFRAAPRHVPLCWTTVARKPGSCFCDGPEHLRAAFKGMQHAIPPAWCADKAVAAGTMRPAALAQRQTLATCPRRERAWIVQTMVNGHQQFYPARSRSAPLAKRHGGHLRPGMPPVYSALIILNVPFLSSSGRLAFGTAGVSSARSPSPSSQRASTSEHIAHAEESPPGLPLLLGERSPRFRSCLRGRGGGATVPPAEHLRYRLPLGCHAHGFAWAWRHESWSGTAPWDHRHDTFPSAGPTFPQTRTFFLRRSEVERTGNSGNSLARYVRVDHGRFQPLMAE